MHDSTMSETAVQWLATLSEVRRQAARAAVLAGVQPLESDGQWYDVAEDRTETSDLETLDETGAWRGLQWLNAFEILFFERPNELIGSEQQDDLLFFVVHEAYQGDGSALLVRRKGRAMPEELGRGGQQAEHIDWRKSVLLNLVIQATYCLTVATCRRTEISDVLQRDIPTAAHVARVSKAVYASPMNIQVDIQGQRSKEKQPSVGYPDICFAIEDFDDAFKGLIVSEPGWCYVVTLSATGGPATAALSLHLAQLQASPVSCPALGFQQGPAPGAAASQSPPPDALGSHPSRQVDARAHMQKSFQTEQHNSSRLQEQPIDSALAGLSLNGGTEASEAARALAQQPEDTIMSHQKGGSANSGLDDPLRRQDKTSLEHSSQAPAHESKKQPGAAIESDQSSHNSAATAQRQGPQQAKQAPQQVCHVAAAQGRIDLPLFTGFVSHEQLEAVIGNTAYERRAASRKELLHWVKMRGPGGQGHADVAVTCLLPLDEGHLKAPTEELPRAKLITRDSSLFQRALSSVAASAAEAAKGFIKDVLGRDEQGDEYVRLRCALMRLSLPVELLAAQLLRLPLQEVAQEV